MLAFDITTRGRCRMHDITGEVRRLLREALTQFPGPRSGCPARADAARHPPLRLTTRRFSPTAKQAILSFSLRAGRKAALTFSPACEVTYEHAP